MIHDFLNFNKECPLCGESLTIYMQWLDFVCFQGSVKDDKIVFKPFIFPQKFNSFKNDNISILNDFTFNFSSNKLFNESKKYQFYFFYLCNPKGFKTFGDGNFDISLYKACYYRSTPFFEIKENNNIWKAEFSNNEDSLLINHDESFSFINHVNDVEKVYMLNLNYQTKKTTIWHYSVSEDQKKDKFFKPNLFEKNLPLLNKRPEFNIEERDNLIERFDNWILLS